MGNLARFVSYSSLLLLLSISLASCSLFKKRTEPKIDPATAQGAVDEAMSQLTLVQLNQASNAFRVAYDKTSDSWQSAGDDAVSGCKISAKVAEDGLASLKPWLDRRTEDEAKRLAETPKTYRPPVDDETCDRECSCGVAIKIFEAAKLDDYSHAKVKELKKQRARFEAKAELLTADRAELCAESATWICKSEMLKALKALP